MRDRLEAIEERYQAIDELMATAAIAAAPEQVAALARERAGLEATVTLLRELRAAERDLDEAQRLADDPDEEMRALARDEVATAQRRRDELNERLRLSLLPQDPNDARDVIVEIRAGAGGGEAALFAADLFRAYARYAEAKNWQAEVLSSNETGIGGFKEIVFEVRGRGAYSRLKYESGVHRVQRVPVTEASGRIHTSTATVAVLPEADEVEINISPDDLRIDIFHAGGHGGQNVQKVATAVRITHLPTGMVVTCQDERSQLRNRQKAMAVLRARLLDREQRQQQAAVSQTRRAQVGTAERSEKIRTYNFPQNRVTDHRSGLTAHNLTAVLDGDLDDLIEAAAAQERTQRLTEMLV